ncbi:MAG: RNA-binding protein [Nanoarchaeota archaeon]|nr:RNA-binding protein [Nanoarchaeota archaeon]MBU4086765.1 RNA-binding protein [Nanoarchaeota archaeon]
MKLYVGNLAWSIDDKKLGEIFSEFGEVSSASVIMDRYSNRSKGFGFVEFADEEAGKKAIAAMNGKNFEGRDLKVSEATPREE